MKACKSTLIPRKTGDSGPLKKLHKFFFTLLKSLRNQRHLRLNIICVFCAFLRLTKNSVNLVLIRVWLKSVFIRV